jgi:hypothetical protein
MPCGTERVVSDTAGVGASAPPEPARAAALGPKSYRRRPQIPSSMLHGTGEGGSPHRWACCSCGPLCRVAGGLRSAMATWALWSRFLRSSLSAAVHACAGCTPPPGLVSCTRETRNVSPCGAGGRWGSWARGGLKEVRVVAGTQSDNGAARRGVSARCDARQRLRKGATCIRL